eukprot:scaffold99757_cov75-Phaeocystis_antarctica.AAC.3
MSLTPQPEPLQQAVFGNRHCNSTCFRHYRALSAAYFAARPRQCFERVRLRALSNTLRLTTYHELLATNYQLLPTTQVRLCDFSRTRPARPWATVQAVLARQTHTPPDAPRLERAMLGQGSRTLQVTFVLRARRRRLANLDELLAACARWGEGRRAGREHVRVSCAAESFAPGLVAMAPAIRRTAARYSRPRARATLARATLARATSSAARQTLIGSPRSRRELMGRSTFDE